MTTYRWVVYTGSVREERKGACTCAGNILAVRRSRSSDVAAVAALVEALKRNPPESDKARAWLERSKNGYTTTMLSYEREAGSVWQAVRIEAMGPAEVVAT